MNLNRRQGVGQGGKRHTPPQGRFLSNFQFRLKMRPDFLPDSPFGFPRVIFRKLHPQKIPPVPQRCDSGCRNTRKRVQRESGAGFWAARTD